MQCKTPLFVVCQGRILRVTGSFREKFAKPEESPENSGFALQITYSIVTTMFHINCQVSLFPKSNLATSFLYYIKARSHLVFAALKNEL